MSSLRVGALLAVGLLAGTARAEVPWESSAGDPERCRPRAYFGLASAGGYLGYHDSEWREGPFSALDALGWDVRLIEYRVFFGRLGAGVLLGAVGASGGWSSSYFTLPTLALYGVTRTGRRSFDYAALRVEFLGYRPLGFEVAYSVVPFPPYPLEFTGAAGVCSTLYVETLWRYWNVRWASGWRATVGVRAGLGSWLMRPVVEGEFGSSF